MFLKQILLIKGLEKGEVCVIGVAACVAFICLSYRPVFCSLIQVIRECYLILWTDACNFPGWKVNYLIKLMRSKNLPGDKSCLETRLGNLSIHLSACCKNWIQGSDQVSPVKTRWMCLNIFLFAELLKCLTSDKMHRVRSNGKYSLQNVQFSNFCKIL